MTGPFTGQFLRCGKEGFADAAVSRVFNQRQPSRRPAAILRAADAADVAAGVRLARAQGLQVTVRSGGHSWASWSLRDNTLLIDLAAFTGMSYDEDSGIVTVGPAVRGGLDLDPYLAAHGRFFAGGHCPTVGLGGFLLQGGMGWNCRGWGWAAESIEAIQVVTADGDIAWCCHSENPDLFWAARGSGPGFCGVVTAFRLRTRPRYRELTQSTYVYPAAAAQDVLGWLYQARHDVPPSVELVAVGITPPLPPELIHEGPVLVVDGVSFDGGAASLAALGTCPVAGKALVSKRAQPVTIGELRAEQIRANPEGHRYTVDNAYLAGEPDSLIPALAPAFTDLPTAKSFSLWFDLAHLPARPLPDMAQSLQTDIYFATYVVGEDPAQDGLCRSWTDATMDRLEPFSAGCYLGDSDFTVRPARFMSDAAWDRFRAIRAARDPDRLFAGYLCADESELNRARRSRLRSLVSRTDRGDCHRPTHLSKGRGLMRAIVVDKLGGPEVLQIADRDDPTAQPGQLLVQVAAAGVNFMDIYQRSGIGVYVQPTPFTPGAEGAGTVLAVGAGVTEFAPGDQVAWVSAPGSYAQQAAVPAQVAVPVPHGVDLKVAAAVMLQGLTAHYLCHSTYPVKEGNVAVVHAAAGGVGLLLTQMVKRLGATVVATTSTTPKAVLAQQAGADHVTGYDEFVDAVRRITGERGAHVVFDGVGKATFDDSLAALRPRGMMVLYGGSSGQVPPFDLQRLNTGGSLYVTRPTLVHYIADRGELLWRAGDLFEWIAKGDLDVRIGAEYPLADAARAHDDLAARRTTGKLLLIP